VDPPRGTIQNQPKNPDSPKISFDPTQHSFIRVIQLTKSRPMRKIGLIFVTSLRRWFFLLMIQYDKGHKTAKTTKRN